MRSALPHMVRRGWTAPPASPEGRAFPYGLGRRGVHEIVAGAYGDEAACAGVAIGALNAAQSGAIVWVSQAVRRLEHGGLSGAGLLQAGMDPARLLFVQTSKTIDALWATEEAARSGDVAAVCADIEDTDFTITRRLSLVSEETGVPVLLLMPFRREGATAAQARWRISPCPSAPHAWDARAPGAPRWRAVLERSRIAPQAAGRTFELEIDDETLSLRLASRLAFGSPAAYAPGAEDGIAQARRRTG